MELQEYAVVFVLLCWNSLYRAHARKSNLSLGKLKKFFYTAMNYLMKQLIKMTATSKPKERNRIILFLFKNEVNCYIRSNEITNPTVCEYDFIIADGGHVSVTVSHSLSLFWVL